MKTIWQIVKTETSTKHKNLNKPLIKINGKLSHNYQTIANELIDIMLTYKLIKSYLSDRYQRVLIGNNSSTIYSSEWEMVCTGVPQGSILGPLLFLIYINDLPFILKDTGTPTLFADDTSIVYSYSNLNKFIK